AVFGFLARGRKHTLVAGNGLEILGLYSSRGRAAADAYWGPRGRRGQAHGKIGVAAMPLVRVRIHSAVATPGAINTPVYGRAAAYRPEARPRCARAPSSRSGCSQRTAERV